LRASHETVLSRKVGRTPTYLKVKKGKKKTPHGKSPDLNSQREKGEGTGKVKKRRRPKSNTLCHIPVGGSRKEVGDRGGEMRKRGWGTQLRGFRINGLYRGL